MTAIRLPLVALTFLLTVSFLQAAGFRDDFSDPKLGIRQALRGEWLFKDNVASCVSDPELYLEYKNHGPILRWPCEINDGTVEFEFKPQDCQRVVITLNEDGHVFRISLKEEGGSSVFGWIGKSSKENKSQQIVKKGVPSIVSLYGQWVKVKLVMNNGAGIIQIGDFKVPIKHESLARDKGEFTFSFASGECAIRNVVIK